MTEERADYAAQREIFSPSALVQRARDLLERNFPLLWVEGEISNFSRPASGHFYFSLKDAQAQVRCAMFKPKSTFLRFRPVDGMRVLARVRVTLYEARGEFQLLVEHMELAGEGALLREFEQLKARLAAEGLFDTARKRPLPRLPRRLGVLTSPTGAAIRDVLSVIARRFPLLEVDILPVPVQGREAPAAIIAMLRAAAALRRHDVFLLTRGGGSLEDLWAFNHEGLARAIRASAIPVVSAIGHEIDFTIADFVADLRAPTPSAAAELLVPDAADLQRHVRTRRDRITRCMQHHLHKLAQRVDHAHARLNTQHPQRRLRACGERLAQLRARLESQHPLRRLRHGAQRLGQLRARLDARQPATLIARRREFVVQREQRLRHALVRRLQSQARHLSELARALNAVSPLATLQRGYAILLDAQSGRVIRAPADAAAGQQLRARVAGGEFLVRKERDDDA
jgi:exodeoxyribonuclease VII large subunit